MSSSRFYSESDEPENAVENLVELPVTRSPVEESFYESYIIQSRIAVDNLYASNVLSCQKHMKEVKDLGRQRKVKLSSFEREKQKLVKRMEELRLKQETVKLIKITTEQNIIDSTSTQKRTENTRTKRRSPLSLTKASTSTGDQSKQVKSPAIQNGLSRSVENISDSPFVTHHGLKVHNDPYRTLVYRGCATAMSLQYKESKSWKLPDSDISTKVKWVPRS